MTRARSMLLVAFVGLACERSGPGPVARTEDENATLGGEIAVRVGDQAIPLSVVASVAAAQKVTVAEAARKVIDDEIAASAARARGRDQRPPASWRLVTARARFTADRLAEEARRMGPPTDDEVRTISERHWTEVDRPPSVRVIHAIVLRPKDPGLLEAAKAVADGIHAAVATARDEDFESKAKAVAHDPKLKVLVERLPAFAEDGRVTEGAGAMDLVFTKAAFALSSERATSEIVETPFGYHVIRLLERVPEKRMPFENRRIAFTEEVHAMRARDLMNARLAALRNATEVVVSPSAETLMRAVSIRTEGAGGP